MLRSIAYIATGSVWGEQLMLEGFLGFEPRVVKLKLTLDYRIKTCLIWGNLGRAPSLQVIPWHLSYNCGKALKTLSVTEKVPVGTIRCVRGHLAGNEEELPILISPD
jgi:hypothetical protein